MTKELNKNTEVKIIEVATELFAQKGFEGTSIRDICKIAGVNISLISYYFGGKEELYKKIVEHIVSKIMTHMRSKFQSLNPFQGPPNFDTLDKNTKVQLLLKMVENIADFFYSSNISDEEIMILFREQMTSGIPINAEGYSIFKKLLASLMGKDENDKEVIFRCITIVGQIHSARILKQFSLKMMKQEQYTQEDTIQFRSIVIHQTKAILKDLGVINSEE